MEHDRNDESNPWKLATLSLCGVIALVLTAGLVVANHERLNIPQEELNIPQEEISEPAVTSYDSPPVPRDVPPPPRAAAPAPRSRPSSTDIEDCNAYAAASRSRAEEALKGGIVGGALGAGVGAAGGAIAKGGKGAGKGAGIGSIVGATVGTLYGLDQANQANARAEGAYRDCMARRGYRG